MNGLRTLVWLLTCGSVSGAALSMHTTERVVSRTLRRLEHECEQELFTRHNRGGLKPTNKCLELGHLARQMVTLVS